MSISEENKEKVGKIENTELVSKISYNSGIIKGSESIIDGMEEMEAGKAGLFAHYDEIHAKKGDGSVETIRKPEHLYDFIGNVDFSVLMRAGIEIGTEIRKVEDKREELWDEVIDRLDLDEDDNYEIDYDGTVWKIKEEE